MPYRLKKGIYAVRCRYPHCTFNTRLEIDTVIMGMTEDDVEAEAMKMAKGMAMVKHDSLHARHHALMNPEIRRVAGHNQPIPISTGWADPVVVPQR